MSQDITPMQILAGGNTLGTVAGAADDNFVGCTFTRTGAGAYTVLFNVVPPGLALARDVTIKVLVLAVDGSTTVCTVTKTLSGTACTGFTVATAGGADTAWNFIAYRNPLAS